MGKPFPNKSNCNASDHLSRKTLGFFHVEMDVPEKVIDELLGDKVSQCYRMNISDFAEPNKT